MCDRPGAGLVPVINRFGVGWKETAAAASKRPNVLQPRDHRAALSLYRDRGEKWGIAQFGREEGLVRPPARVTCQDVCMYGKDLSAHPGSLRPVPIDIGGITRWIGFLRDH